MVKTTQKKGGAKKEETLKRQIKDTQQLIALNKQQLDFLNQKLTSVKKVNQSKPKASKVSKERSEAPVSFFDQLQNAANTKTGKTAGIVAGLGTAAAIAYKTGLLAKIADAFKAQAQPTQINQPETQVQMESVPGTTEPGKSIFNWAG
jgi:hypothetical protein